jgi:hypothetical protein
MKLNFNRAHSISLAYDSEVNVRWLNAYIKGFLEHHDLKHDGASDALLMSPKGIKMLAEWIAASGVQVSYWEVDHRVKEDGPPIAFGLEFREDCPLFIEAKLRHS